MHESIVCLRSVRYCDLFSWNIHFNYVNFELEAKNSTIRFLFLISGKEDKWNDNDVIENDDKK